MASHAAFIRLFMPIQGDLLAYLLSIGVPPVDAEDVLQEAAVDMIDKFEGFRAGTNFRAWAYAFVRNEALRYFKTRARRPLALSPEAVEAIEAIALESPEPPVLSRALAVCLDRLHRFGRSLLAMRYHENLSVSEIARRMNRPVDSVYTTMSRIRKALQECIERSSSRLEAAP